VIDTHARKTEISILLQNTCNDVTYKNYEHKACIQMFCGHCFLYMTLWIFVIVFYLSFLTRFV